MTARDASLDDITGTALADLSANIFSVFLIIWLALLAANTASVPAGPVELADDPRLVQRMPLRANDLVNLLRQSGPEQPGVSIELMASGIRAGGGSIEIAADPARPFALQAQIRRILQAGDRAGAARLYVFDPASYAPAVAALRAEGMPWVEMNVPLALQGQDAGQASWSREFKSLQTSRLGIEAYRTQLALLLAGGEQAGERGAAINPPIRFSASLSKYWQFGREIMHWTALCGGLMMVWLIERRGKDREKPMAVVSRSSVLASAAKQSSASVR